MAQITIPCLVGKTSKSGVTSWYWQPSKTLAAAGWKPLALGKNQSAAIAAAQERNQQVDAWKTGGRKPPEVRARRQLGTVSALVDRYRREVLNGQKPDGRPLLRAKTRMVYETSLKRIEAWAGKHPVAYITPARVRALRDATAKPVEQGGLGHASAFNLLRQLRQLLAFAESIDVLPKGSNPATDFALASPPPRRLVWEADDEAAFIAAAYHLGFPSMALAIELAIYTAQREGDLIAFTAAQLQELDLYIDAPTRQLLAGPDGKVMGWLFNQEKTSDDYVSVDMQIPLEPVILQKVQAAIRHNRAQDRAATPPRLLTHVLIDDRTGLPWKLRGFGQVMRNIANFAATATGRTHMQDLVWHDLRRTRVVRLRRRNMPKEMIASITGHSLKAIEEMLKVYGPVDPTITANALATTLALPTATPATNPQEQSA